MATLSFPNSENAIKTPMNMQNCVFDATSALKIIRRLLRAFLASAGDSPASTSGNEQTHVFEPQHSTTETVSKMAASYAKEKATNRNTNILDVDHLHIKHR